MKNNRSTAVVWAVILFSGCSQHANPVSDEPKGVPATEGGVKLYVVTVDGSVSESALQTITLKLQPPASIGNQPKLRSIVPIKEILSQAIIDAASQTSAALQGRKDLSLSELAASIKFVVEKSGGAGAKLEALPVNLSAKQSYEGSTTNVIDVTFKSLDDNPT